MSRISVGNVYRQDTVERDALEKLSPFFQPDLQIKPGTGNLFKRNGYFDKPFAAPHGEFF
jgi:hypothetical protein